MVAVAKSEGVVPVADVLDTIAPLLLVGAKEKPDDGALTVTGVACPTNENENADVVWGMVGAWLPNKEVAVALLTARLLTAEVVTTAAAETDVGVELLGVLPPKRLGVPPGANPDAESVPIDGLDTGNTKGPAASVSTGVEAVEALTASDG